VRVEGGLAARPRAAVETALYRIVEEALRNVVQHAGVASAAVRVWREDDRLCCSVHDRGKGFEMSSGMAGRSDRGLGLIAIRERVLALGGTLHVDTAMGRGTELVVSVPTEE
jgi:signal transduction histidine kinase